MGIVNNFNKSIANSLMEQCQLCGRSSFPPSRPTPLSSRLFAIASVVKKIQGNAIDHALPKTINLKRSVFALLLTR
jgi:hypothetical protein